MEYMKPRKKIQKEKLNLRTYDTKVSVIEKEYGVNLGVAADMKLGKYLEEMGYPSLAQMLK